jgi:hypothetical protein
MSSSFLAQDLLFLEEFIDPGLVSQERLSASSAGGQLIVSSISFGSLSALLEHDPAMRQDFYQHAALDLALHLKRLGPHAYGKSSNDKSRTTKSTAEPRNRKKNSENVSQVHPRSGKWHASEILKRRMPRTVSADSASGPIDESMELVSGSSEEEVEEGSEEAMREEDWRRWAELY